eukprot:CAMPEP_0197887322 /NCGR_PEP_ID=MMETSP1439-20131203/19365_1 /TAXON_ID=66791 /ORGANISM="Gonyaulax spinifera, Strain CCMP409" /LENGTH=41 /DNA_ID= /DNA_START= /DNA_END= /DNA_ORIENTATION=
MDDDFDKGTKKVVGSKTPIGSGLKGSADIDKGAKKVVMATG